MKLTDCSLITGIILTIASAVHVSGLHAEADYGDSENLIVESSPAILEIDRHAGFEIHLDPELGSTALWQAVAGDINGDGIDDLIIGLPLASPQGREQAGLVAVVFGRNDRFDPQVNLADLDRERGFLIEGQQAGGRLGWSLDVLADFSGNGVNDLVVGAPGRVNESGSGTGAAYVLFGNSQFPNLIDPDALVSGAGLRLQGDEQSLSFGFAVAAIGDFNGNGLSELAIGDPDASAGDIPGAGTIHVISGGYLVWPAANRIHTVDASADVLVIRGSNANQLLGASLAAAGDFTGNGHAGLLAGAPGTDSAYLLFGGLQGTGEAININQLAESDAAALVSGSTNEQFGLSVARFQDHLVVGAPLADSKQGEDAGAVYLIADQAALSAGTHRLEESGTLQFQRMSAAGAGQRLGFMISNTGDLRGDGQPDMVVSGAPWSGKIPARAARSLPLLLTPPALPADLLDSTVATPAEPQEGLDFRTFRFDGRGLTGPYGTRYWAVTGLGKIDGKNANFVIFGDRAPANANELKAAKLHVYPARLRTNHAPLINGGDGIPNQIGTSNDNILIEFAVTQPGEDPDSFAYNAGFTLIDGANPGIQFTFGGSGENRLLTIQTGNVNPTGSLGRVVVTVTNLAGESTNAVFIVGLRSSIAPTLGPMRSVRTYDTRSVTNPFTIDFLESLDGGSGNETVVMGSFVEVSGDPPDGQVFISATGIDNPGQTVIWARAGIFEVDTGSNYAYSGFLLDVLPETPPFINDGEGIVGPFEVDAGQSLTIPYTIGDLIDPPELLATVALIVDPAEFPNEQLNVSCDANNPEQCLLEITTHEFDHNLSPVTLQVWVCYPECGTAAERSAFTDFDVIIDQAPQPPVINENNPIPDQAIFEGQADSLQFTVTEPVPCDPGAGPLVVNVFSQDPGLIADADLDLVDLGGDLYELTIQTMLDALGQAGITISASNCAGAVDSSFSVEILERPGPEFNAGAGIPDQVVLTGEMLQVPFSISDAFDAPEDIDVAATSNDPELLPDAAITLDSPCAGGECVLIINAPEATGTVVISVTATNSADRATNEDFALIVEQAPVAPVINNNFQIPDQTIFEGQSDSVGFTVSEPIPCDPVDDQLSVTATSSSPQLIAQGNLNLVDFGDGNFELTIQTTLGATGTAVVTISASNCAGTTDSSFNVEILPRPGPQINDGAGIFDQSVLAGESINIEFIVSDQFDLPESISVVASSGTPALVDNVAITVGGGGSQRTLTIETEAELPGEVTILVTAFNSAGRSTTTSFVLNIVKREPPLIHDGEALEDRHMTIGETIEVEFSVADAIDPSDALAVSAHSSIQVVLADAAITIEGTGTERTLVLDGSDATVGITRITIVVENTAGITSTLAFELTVIDPPTTLDIELTEIQSGPSPDIYYRVDVENSGDHDAHGVVLEATLEGDYDFLGVYSLAEDCDDADGVVTCDADSISTWSCESTDAEAHCSLLLLPTGISATAVIHLLGNGAGLLEASSLARNSAKVSDNALLGE